MTLRETLDALNAAVRDAYSQSGKKYCWVDDADQTKCWAWIEEKTYEIPYQIDADGKVKLGDRTEVRRKTVYAPVFNFSAFDLNDVIRDAPASAFAKDFKLVARKGLIFEAGEYPDKGVNFDEADLLRAAENFAPVQNDLEHQPTVLDGMLGGLESVEVTDGKMFGVVTIPEWLDELYQGEPLKVSLAWNRDKKIVGNALVLNPRIKDAHVVAAFSAVSSNRETIPADAQRRTKMTLKEWLKTAFGISLNSIDDQVSFADPSGGEAPVAPATPTTLQLQAGQVVVSQSEIDSLRATASQFAEANTATGEASLTAEATAFADGLVKAGKLGPTFRDGLIVTYKSVALAGSGGQFKFSTDGKFEGGDPLKNLIASYDAFPVNPAFAEQIEGGSRTDGLAVIFGNDKPATGDRVNELLKKSKLGQAALAKVGK